MLRNQHEAARGLRARAERAALAALLAGMLAMGCASGPKSVKGCVRFNASENLNLYDGQPHVVTIYLYPLASVLGFQQASVDDLLGGATPPGVLSNPVALTVAPGEEDRVFEDLFPAQTIQLGVLADYYRAPGDPEGARMQVVRARCGWRKPKLVLSAKDLYLE